MAERSWTEPWPSWVRKWYGIALRVILGLVGTLVGLGLILLANFSASYKKTPPEWNGESVTVLVLGMITVVVAIAMAIRPSRLTALVAAAVALSIPVVGYII